MNVKINIHVDKIKDKVIEQVTKYLIEVGERCIVEARNNSLYTNQTGNLRNSIGYVVMNRGVEIGKSNITSLNQKTIDQVKAKYNQDVVLIVVAGMNYAAYVEAKNYNVLTSAELLAERLLKQVMIDNSKI